MLLLEVGWHFICHRYGRGTRQTNGGQVKPRAIRNEPEFIEDLRNSTTKERLHYWSRSFIYLDDVILLLEVLLSAVCFLPRVHDMP